MNVDFKLQQLRNGGRLAQSLQWLYQGLDVQRIAVRFPSGTKRFSLFSEAFRRGPMPAHLPTQWVQKDFKLTSHLVSRLRMGGAIPHLLIYHHDVHMDFTYDQQHDTKLKQNDVTSTDTSVDLSHELFHPLSDPCPDLSAPDFFLRGGGKMSYDIRPHTTEDLNRQRLQKTCCTTSGQISRDVKEMHWNGRRKSLKSCFRKATSTETNLPNPQTVNNTDIFVVRFLSAH